MTFEWDKTQSLLIQDYEPNRSTSNKSSAVIVPIEIDSMGNHFILFTKRALHLKSHPGQISFPGGTLDPTDANLLDCALREWKEELGLGTESLKIFGRLKGFDTGTGFHITPIIAQLPKDLPYKPDQNEVADLFSVSLEEFWNARFFVLDWKRQNREEKIYYWDLSYGLLWGATAGILHNILTEFCLWDRKPIPVLANLDNPPFFTPNS